MGSNKTRLEFYDGWHVDYVYFNSLLKVDTWNEKRDIYDMEFVSRKASEAASDAQQNMHLNSLNEDESIEAFRSRFEQIISFLKQAYQYEQQNEEVFFSTQYNKLISSFSEEEIKHIPQLQECIKILNDGTRSFDYDKFTTLINILQKGLYEAKMISEHESKRIEKLDQALDDMLSKKWDQLEGLAFSQEWKNPQERIKKAYNRFTRKIQVEYAKTSQLTNKHKNGKYVIRGAYRFKNISQTAYRELASWAENTIRSLKDNSVLIAKLVEIIAPNYPTDGNFNKLIEPIRTAIAWAVTQYGKKHLFSILNKRIKPIQIDDIVNELTSKDNSIIDMIMNFKVSGLPKNFGQNAHEARIYEDVSRIEDAKSATELYIRINQLIQREEIVAKSQGKSNSLLIQAMSLSPSNSDNNLYEESLNIISTIEQIKNLQKQIEEDIKTLTKLRQAQEKEYELMTKNGDLITVKVIIKDGKASIDMSELNEFVVNQDVVKNSNATSITNLIRSTTTQASKQLKQNIITALTNAHNQNLFGLSESQLVNEVEGELRNIKIYINGPKLEELLATIDFSMKNDNTRTIYNAGKNNKNDFVTIGIDSSNSLKNLEKKFIELNKPKLANAIAKGNELIQQAQFDLMEQIQRIADDEINKIVHSNSSSFRYSFASKFSIDNLEELRKEYKAIDEAYINLEKVTHTLLDEKLGGKGKLGKSYDIIKQESLLTSLQAAFRISATVKSYNTYNNQMGFAGGSLGSNFDAQLNTIADIFQTAGLPIDDLKWIRSAILNCFPSSVVGESNKGLLENYLGAVAAFALFDEGGDETKLISNLYSEYFSNIQNKSSAHVLHLYHVNSLLVPGSQVILRTINTLEQEILPQINNIPTTMHRGAGVTIINTVSQKNITGNGKGTWAATGASAANEIQIQILFLAQLLDIVNAINKEIGNIELPK